MAVAPINKVEEVLVYALSEIDKDKILLGIPLYGYDWTLPYIKGRAFARSIDQLDAYDIPTKYNVPVQYSSKSQAPFFMYFDEDGLMHEVWFDDARSYQEKFNLVKKHDVLGLYNRVLGFNSPSNWLMMKNNFKRPNS